MVTISTCLFICHIFVKNRLFQTLILNHVAYFWSESLIFDMISWRIEKNPEKQERNLFRSVAGLFRWTLSSFLSQLLKKSRRDYSLFFFFAVLPNFQQQNRQHLVTRNVTVATQASRKPITSKEWCWNQVRSWKAGRRCLAPLWRMTNSTQKTARFRGFTGWSWWILDNFIAFSL